MKIILFLGLFPMILLAESTDIDLNHLKCLVCRTTMKEVDNEILQTPDKVVNVGNHRMDALGNTVYKQVPLRQSEVHISEILDNICEKMNDYVRAKRKSDNRLILINLMLSGAMNPQISKVDIVQDGDLNKSLLHYCSSIVEEYEDDIISLYVNKKDDKTEKLCTHISHICEKYIEDEDNDDDDNDIHLESESVIKQHKDDEL